MLNLKGAYSPLVSIFERETWDEAGKRTEQLTENRSFWAANRRRLWFKPVSFASTVPGREASTSAQAVWTTASSGPLASSPTQTRETTLVSVHPRTLGCFGMRKQWKIHHYNLFINITHEIQFKTLHSSYTSLSFTDTTVTEPKFTQSTKLSHNFLIFQPKIKSQAQKGQ